MVDLFFIIKWYIRCYILNLIFGKTHGRRFCAVLIFSQCKRKPSFLHFAVEIGIFDEYLKYPLSFRGGPKRTLLMLIAIFKYCYFCVPSLSMLFSTLFPTIQNLMSSNYVLNNLCLSAESTSRIMKQGVSTAPFQLGTRFHR